MKYHIISWNIMKYIEISWNTVSWNIMKLDTYLWLLMFASIINKDASHLANCIQKKKTGRQSSAKWQDRQQQDGDVQGSEVQIHGDPKKPTNDDGEGHHEESDLRAASKGHSQGEIHLIFGGHRHSCEMLRRIAHLGAPQCDLRKTWELGVWQFVADRCSNERRPGKPRPLSINFEPPNMLFLVQTLSSGQGTPHRTPAWFPNEPCSKPEMSSLCAGWLIGIPTSWVLTIPNI